MMCFVRFDLKMCFVPQRRAILHFSSGQLAPRLPLVEPTCRPRGATNHWKKYSVSRLHLLSSDFFSSLIFLSLLFSDSLHLCFAICPHYRKFAVLLLCILLLYFSLLLCFSVSLFFLLICFSASPLFCFFAVFCFWFLKRK